MPGEAPLPRVYFCEISKCGVTALGARAQQDIRAHRMKQP